MRQKLLLLLLCGLFSLNLWTQSNPIFLQIEQAKQDKVFQHFPVFTENADLTQRPDLQHLLHQGTIVDIESSVLKQIVQEGLPFITLTFPLEDEKITIELFQQAPTKKDVQFKNSATQKISYQGGQYYRGIVQGDEKSVVAISFFPTQMVGLVSSPKLGNIVIGKLGNQNTGTTHIIYQDHYLTTPNKFACHADELPYLGNTQLPQLESTKSSTCGKVIDIYLEADHFFYERAGNSSQNVIDYVTALFNIVATLYYKEEVGIQISEIKVWDTTAPYSTTDATEALFDFRDELQGDFNGDLAQLLSLYADDTGFGPNGGLAYIDKLCRPFLSVGYSNIDGVFSLLPNYSWDVLVVTHELGHGIASPHTHSCSWGVNGDQSLDDCFETEGSCPLGDTPIDGGTIMSYCHSTTAGTNLSNGFGIEPGNLIRSRVANANCLNLGTENFTATVDTDGSTSINEGESIELYANPESNTHIYQWYRNGIAIPNASKPIYEATEAGNYSVEIAKGGCTDLSNEVQINVSAFQVNMSCNPSDCSNCNGRSIVIDAGVSGTNYNWSTGANTRTLEVFDSGTYSVTVSNGSTTAMGSTTVNFTTQTRTDNIAICEGETYTIGNSTYQNAGNYTDFITNPNGCMIEVNTQLTVNSNTEETNAISICAGESYTVGNSVYTQSGTYVNESNNANGCTHTTTTVLTVNPTYRNEQDITICEGGSYTIGNSTYTSAGTYENNFSTVSNCDSIIITRLSVAENYQIEQDINLCEGESIRVGNSTYNQTGDYTDQLMASDGCDSLVMTRLTIFQNYNLNNQVAICAGESIIVGNSTYTYTGTYTDQLMSSNGCDSIITTQLDVLENSDFEQNITICTGENLTVGNSTYTQSGTYIDVLSSVNNCDSTITTILVVSDEILEEENLTLCYGATYNGEVITNNSTFTDTVVNADGCDSTYQLNIQVLPEITITFNQTNIDCSQTKGAINTQVTGGMGSFNYLWSNQATTPNLQNLSAGTYILTVTDANGCTSISSTQITNEGALQIEQEVTPITCAGDRDAAIDINISGGVPPYSAFWSNGPIEEDQTGLGAGEYRIFINDSNGCAYDTTFVIENPPLFNVSATFTGTTTNTGTATANPEGGVAPYFYSWSNGGFTRTIENLTPGEYSVTATDANGCRTSTTVTVDMTSSLEDIGSINNFQLYPNPNAGQFQIELELQEAMEVEVLIYNVIGQQIQTQTFAKEQRFKRNIQLLQPSNGMYWVVFKTKDWQFSRRFLVAL